MPQVIDWREVGDSDDTTEDGRSYTRLFIAKVDTALCRSWQVKADPRCPKVFEFDRDGGGFCRSVSAVRRGRQNRLFDVTAQYGFDLSEESDQDPLDRPAQVSSQGIERQVPAIVDVDGNPIENRAGDLIEGIMVDEPGVIFKVQKNIPAGPAGWLQRAANRVNKDAVTIDGLKFKPGTLLVRKPSVGVEQLENDVGFRQASLEVHYSQSGWQLNVWNAGYHAIEESYVLSVNTGQSELVRQKVLITDDKNEPIRKPQMLDAAGKQFLEVGPDGRYRAKKPIDRDELVKLTFTIRGESDFGKLPLR